MRKWDLWYAIPDLDRAGPSVASTRVFLPSAVNLTPPAFVLPSKSCTLEKWWHHEASRRSDFTSVFAVHELV